jgi:hypothetical protein
MGMKVKEKRVLHTYLIAGLIVIAGFVGYIFIFTDVVDPNSQTALAMNNCKQRIQKYAIEHNALPASLSDTNEIKGTFNSNKDVWGNDIIYSVDANGLVTLTSLGKDNKPGGEGKNKDMTGTYQSRGLGGGWARPEADWIKRPYRGLQTRRR